MGGGGKVKVIKGVNEEDTNVQTHKTCTAGDRGCNPRGPMEEHQLLADAATLLIQGCTKTWGRQPFSPVSSHSTGSRWWEPGKASAVPAHMGTTFQAWSPPEGRRTPSRERYGDGERTAARRGVQPGDRGHQGRGDLKMERMRAQVQRLRARLLRTMNLQGGQPHTGGDLGRKFQECGQCSAWGPVSWGAWRDRLEEGWRKDPYMLLERISSQNS